MQMRRRLGRGNALLALVLVGSCSACSGLVADGSNETLPPLVPGNTAPPVTQAPAVGPDGNPVVNTQGSTTTAVAQDPGSLEADDANPTSVAARFLAAVAGNDAATAAGLEMPDRRPTVFDWALGAFQQYTGVAGASAWGSPACNEPSGGTVQCSWLQIDAAPTLQLVQDGNAWRVSHPVFTRPGEPTAAGSGCIVGSDNVNFRGGPGTSWPRFAQINPGSCAITVFDAVENDPIEGDQWRYIEFEGRRGWVVDRVVQLS
jgi:hypothetical protein